MTMPINYCVCSSRRDSISLQVACDVFQLLLLNFYQFEYRFSFVLKKGRSSSTRNIVRRICITFVRVIRE